MAATGVLLGQVLVLGRQTDPALEVFEMAVNAVRRIGMIELAEHVAGMVKSIASETASPSG